MSTLASPPVAELLRRLFQEDEAASPASDPSTSAYWSSLTAEDRDRLVRSRTEYRDLYGRMRDLPLAVSRETGMLLYMMARAARARTIVEFGASFGVSTIHLAAALRDNGGGRLITTEFEPSKLAKAKTNLKAAGLEDLVEFREGDALETLAEDLPDRIDLVLLDGAKALYPDVLRLLEDRIAPAALILADNADMAPDYLQRVRSGTGYLSAPLGEDVEVSLRL